MQPSSFSPRARESDGQPLLDHLDAAYNLARWLSRNDQDARDIVQESFLRAVRFADQRRDSGASATRAWLLKIVRNTSHTWLARNRSVRVHKEQDRDVAATDCAPDEALERRQEIEALRRAIAALPDEFREVIVLRELEQLSYKEIAQIAALPIGTVMSRLARARERLKELLAERRPEVSR